MSIFYQQSPQSFERELERKAEAYRRKVVRAQRAFDTERESSRADILQRIAEADTKMRPLISKS